MKTGCALGAIRRDIAILALIALAALAIPRAWAQTATGAGDGQPQAAGGDGSITGDGSPDGLAEGEAEDFFPDDEIPVLEGEGVTVAREIPKAAQSKTVTRAEIEKLRSPDLAGLLGEAFGLEVTRYGGYGNVAGINVRGFGMGRVALLIDGIPVNSAQSGDFDLNSVNLGSIERIEVVYGGSDSRFNVSGATGGTVNIVTVPKAKKGLSVALDAKNLSQIPASRAGDLADAQGLSVTVASGGEAAGWTVGGFANRAGNHYLFASGANATARRVGNEILDAGASASLSLSLSPTSRLALSGSLYGGDKGIPGPIGSSSGGAQRDLKTREAATLDLNRVGSDRLDAELSASHDYAFLSWDDAASSSAHRMHTVNAVNRWGLFASDSLQLSFGADFRHASLDSTNTGIVSRADSGAFASAEWRPSKLLMVTPSVKVALDGARAIPVPKLGLVWFIGDGLTVKNNAFRAYKLPNLNDLYWTGDPYAEGNPDLESEDGLGTDAIIAWRKAGEYSAEASGYFTWYRDSIHWQSSGGKTRPMNCREAIFAGSDLRVESDFSERLKLRLAYSFLQTRVRTELFGFADGKRVPYQSEHRLSADVSLSRGGTSAYLGERYESERFTAIENLSKLPARFTLDAGFARELGSHWSVYVDAKNILGESYQAMEGYPMQGASVTIGMRARFATRD